MALTTHVNVDSSDSPLNTSGVDWVEFSENNDQLIFTAVADITTKAELISAGLELIGSQIVVSNYL